MSKSGKSSGRSPEEDLTARIDALAAEERELHERAGAGTGLSAADRERLEQVQLEADQLWDLRRQREARADAGKDPDGAEPREPAAVRHYLQ